MWELIFKALGYICIGVIILIMAWKLIVSMIYVFSSLWWLFLPVIVVAAFLILSFIVNWVSDFFKK